MAEQDSYNILTQGLSLSKGGKKKKSRNTLTDYYIPPIASAEENKVRPLDRITRREGDIIRTDRAYELWPEAFKRKGVTRKY